MPGELKRGLTHAEAITYTGVKRAQFETVWRPRLTPMRQGSIVLFDRQQIDALFDQFMAAALPAGHDDEDSQAQNAARNERPAKKGTEDVWAVKQRASSPRPMARGASTVSSEVLDFDIVASSILKKRTAGSPAG